MKIFLLTETGPRRRITPPTPSEYEAKVEGKCPHCATENFRVAGKGQHEVDDRAYEANGFCVECKKHVGTIRAEPDTLFGLKEDRAVLQGRARVY